MSNEKLVCRVNRKMVDGNEMYEGTINLQGAQPTKLIKGGSGTSTFANKSALAASARSFARRHGFDDVEFEEKARRTSTHKNGSRSNIAQTTQTAEVI